MHTAEIQEFRLSQIYRDLGLEDIQFIEWADVGRIERILNRECAITAIYYRCRKYLTREASRNLQDNAWNAALHLTRRMAQEGMPRHLISKVEWFHWMRILSETLGEPQSIGQILLSNVDDENMLSCNHVPLRITKGTLYVLRVPGDVITED